MAGYIGSIPVPQATQTREAFTATSNQTTFNTGGYTAGFIDVYLNGVKLAAADFTATNGSDVVLASGASANDILEVVAYTAFEVLNQNFTGTTTVEALTTTGDVGVGGQVTITTPDNGTQLTLESTDADAAVGPVLDLFRNSASPSNFDILGKVLFSGEDNGGNKTEYAHLQAYPQTVTGGAESGYFEIHSLVGGTDRVRMEANATEVVINNPGIDSDFRVESDNSTHALFVQGSDGNIGINTSSITSSAANRTVLELNGTSTSLFNMSIGGTRKAYLYHDDSAFYISNVDNTPLQFYTNNTERMRITSSGALQLSDVNSPNDINTSIFSNSDVLEFEAFGTNGAIAFSTGSSVTERMRISSSGDLLVGTTDTTVYDNNSNTTADNGLNLRGDGKLDAARYNGIVLGLNLTGNDGTIVDLRKAGTTVGTIGVGSGDLIVGNGSVGVRFNDSISTLVPRTTSDGASDGAIDIGAGSARFKDLYLSGGAYIGGTGSANYLNDYEEGTFTPLLSGSNPSGGNPTYNVQLGLYTKIGNMVEFNLCVSCVASSLESSNNDLVITGLPFTNLPSSSPTGQNFPTLTTWPQSGINNTTTTQGYGALIGNSSTNITIYGHVSSTGSNYVNVKYNELSTSSSNNSFQIRITGTYRTNA